MAEAASSSRLHAPPSLKSIVKPACDSSSDYSSTIGRESKSSSIPTPAGPAQVEKSPDYKKAIQSLTPVNDLQKDEERSTPVNDEGKVKHDIRGSDWFLLCLVMCAVNALYGLDTTMSGVIQASISDSFTNVTKIGWIGIGFTLGSVVTMLPLDKAYALIDNKWVFLGSLATFAAGSALCGGAPNMNALIIGRVWAGAGGAGVYQGTRHLVNILTTPKQQPLYTGMIGFAYGGGSIHLLPFICFYVCAILLSGALLRKVGYHREWFIVSGILLTCGGALMHTIRPDTPLARTHGYTIILGLGMMTTQAGYAIGPVLVKPHQSAEVAQFLTIAQGQGILIGLTVASSAFQNITFSRLKEVLADTTFSGAEIHAVVAGARSIVLKTVSVGLRARCIDVIARSISDVWLLVTATGALFTLCSCFLSRKRFLGVLS